MADKSSEEDRSPLKNTTDFLDQADREIIGDQELVQNSESNLLDGDLESPTKQDDRADDFEEEVSGQRALDSDEFEDELQEADCSTPSDMIQPAWKIAESDTSTNANNAPTSFDDLSTDKQTEAATEDQSTDRQRGVWGQVPAQLIVKPQAVQSSLAGLNEAASRSSQIAKSNNHNGQDDSGVSATNRQAADMQSEDEAYESDEAEEIIHHQKKRGG